MTRTMTKASAPVRTPACLVPRAAAHFFRLLAASGSVSYAAKRSGLSRTALYYHRKTNPAFGKRWADALELGVAKVRDEVSRRAVVGIKKPVFQGGRVVGKVKVYDNRLLWCCSRRTSARPMATSVRSARAARRSTSPVASMPPPTRRQVRGRAARVGADCRTQLLMNARRSVLSCSECVIGNPCDAPA